MEKKQQRVREKEAKRVLDDDTAMVDVPDQRGTYTENKRIEQEVEMERTMNFEDITVFMPRMKLVREMWRLEVLRRQAATAHPSITFPIPPTHPSWLASLPQYWTWADMSMIDLVRILDLNHMTE